MAPIAGAVALLDGLDPATAPVHPPIIRAALRHSQTVPDARMRLAWARYAHLGSYRLHGPYDPTTRQATLLYALALSESGRVLDAYRLHRHRLAVAQLCGPPEDLLAAHRDHAEARHAISQCEQADAEIRQALIWWHGHPALAGEGTRLLCSYAVILTGCGQNRAALRTLRAHPDLMPDTDAGLAELAGRLTAVQDVHPPICRRHPTGQPPSTTTAQRRTDWHEILRGLPPIPRDLAWARTGRGVGERP
ncbi:hypothetical protein [Actinoplanes sp. NPDC051411]|uniref:hypothetical protein n=1 Tax=Actinoplanes sp. NPDC051411 TaxID=3155522 RepID=UPI003420B455